MFFKNDSHNLLLLIAVVLIVLCNCKNIAGFDTMDNLNKIKGYYDYIEKAHSDLGMKINDLGKYLNKIEKKSLSEERKKMKKKIKKK